MIFHLYNRLLVQKYNLEVLVPELQGSVSLLRQDLTYVFLAVVMASKSLSTLKISSSWLRTIR